MKPDTAAERERMLAMAREFRSRTGLSAQRFWRLSSDPTWLDGLTAVERLLVLTARQVNEVHYLPYCKICLRIVHYGTSQNEVRTWLHRDETAADHVAEQVSHPDSYRPHPAGLAYMVWSHATVLAWVLNDGTVHYPSASTGKDRFGLVRAALGDHLPAVLED